MQRLSMFDLDINLFKYCYPIHGILASYKFFVVGNFVFFRSLGHSNDRNAHYRLSVGRAGCSRLPGDCVCQASARIFT